MTNNQNDHIIEACTEIFDIYIRQVSKALENESNTLKMIEGYICDLQADIERSKSRKLKIKYLLSFIPKFIVAFLSGDTGWTSFDDYRYYAMQKTGVIPGYSSAKLNEFQASYKDCNENVQFMSKLKGMLTRVKTEILASPEVAHVFFDKFSRKEKDTNFYYRLFDVLNEMHFDIKEVYTMAVNGFIGNIKSSGFEAVEKVNACVKKYKA